MSLGKFGRNLFGEPLLESRLVLNFQPPLWRTTFKKTWPFCPLYYSSLTYSLPLVENEPLDERYSYYSWSIVKQNSFTKSSDTPIRKRLISSLRLDTKDGAYFKKNLKFQGVVKYAHISLTKVDEFFHLIFPHFSMIEPINKNLLEDLPSHWPTS